MCQGWRWERARGLFPKQAVQTELVTEKKKQQETELKTYALLSAFILVNTLSDCNLQGSCLSQTSSSALPSKIPIKTSVLVANGRGEGTVSIRKSCRRWPREELVCSWMSNVLTCTAKSSLGFRGAVELCKHLLLSRQTHSPGKDIGPCSRLACHCWGC